MALKRILDLVIFSVFFLAVVYWDEFLCHTLPALMFCLTTGLTDVMVPSDAGVIPLKL